MEQGLKQRLVGALVIVTLAVIFVPMLFDEQNPAIDVLDIDAPNPPELSNEVIEAPSRPVMLSSESIVDVDEVNEDELIHPLIVEEDSSHDDSVEAVNDSENAVSQPVVTENVNEPADDVSDNDAVELIDDSRVDPPQLSAQNIPKSWVVQLAAFKEKSNADDLVKKLQHAEFKAYLKPTTSGEIFRVFVGPELTKEKANQLQKTLKQTFKLDGIVVNFTS